MLAGISPSGMPFHTARTERIDDERHVAHGAESGGPSIVKLPDPTTAVKEDESRERPDAIGNEQLGGNLRRVELLRARERYGLAVTRLGGMCNRSADKNDQCDSEAVAPSLVE